ncbi:MULTISPECIES: DUF5689 domain-containing protein [unclassified Allomuricauda]|uniref:DUF5689 domain-containing protein n=1 Tax=unclassified Allomuricauda TaxID=2615049 RepID=UPI00273F126A|nr:MULTISPECIES: DUF5689 domain-containing protein [unclassified Allomuricauda]
MKNLVLKSIGIVLAIIAWSCVEGREFGTLEANCTTDITANITFAALDSLVQDDVVQIQEDWVLEGYVISSDKAGNFFNVLYLQDRPTNPSGGLRLETDLQESHLLYPVGSKVYIKLKELYLDRRGTTLELGGVFSSFGNLSVGRLPRGKVFEHVFSSCEGVGTVHPFKTTISEIDSIPSEILVQLDSLEFAEDILGETYAIPEEETERILMDCAENQITLLNSGYSDFQAEPLPQTNGTLTAILTKDGKSPQLIIRSLEDVSFTNDRCPEIITEFTSNRIFISELADPDNNSGARFVELYNASEEPLDLNLWTLRRYTNDNTEVSSTIDLTGFIINGESTLVISPNASEFELVYGFPPDLGVSTNSPADSNGDDNLELVDPFGTVIDAFGVIGEDGSGTNHEFEDGRAVRNIEITTANPVYTFSEWTIFNDTGEAGTVQQPQNAPEDFTPSVRE